MVYPCEQCFRTIGIAENVDYALVVIINTSNDIVFQNGVFQTRKAAQAEKPIINRNGNRKQYLHPCYPLAATSRSAVITFRQGRF